MPRYYYKKNKPKRKKKKQSLFSLFFGTPKIKTRKKYFFELKSSKRRYKGRVYNHAFIGSKVHQTIPLHIALKEKYISWFLFILIFTQIYLVFFSSFFTIKHFNINGLGTFKEEKYQEILETVLESKKYYLLPLNNIFLFNQEKLLSSINTKYNLEELKIEKNVLDKEISITIKEKVPVLIYIIEDENYYLDVSGSIISQITTDITQETLPVIYDVTEKTIDIDEITVEENIIGKEVLNQQFLASLTKIQDFSKEEINFDVSSFKISSSPKVSVRKEIKEPKTSNNEFKVSEDVEEDEVNEEKEAEPKIILEKIENENNHIYKELVVVLKNNVEVYFGNEPFLDNNQIDVQLNNLSQIALKLNENLDSLSYIDLRLINKIFYK